MPEEMFFQDVDLCLKVKKQGLDVVLSNNLIAEPRRAKKDIFSEKASAVLQLFVSQWKSALQKMAMPFEVNLNVMWDLYCGCTGNLVSDCF
jgi:hypothetical protein